MNLNYKYIFEDKFNVNQKELYEFTLYFGLLFLFPVIFTHLSGLPNQIFVGTAVNFLLVLSAFYIQGWKNIFLIIIPSIGAYLSGFIFGSSSIFLLYLIPAIWLGNFVYVYLIKKISVAKNKLIHGIAVASFIKSILLFSVAGIFVYLNLIPDLFLLAMGPLQLVTALLGGFFGGLVCFYRRGK